MTSSIYTDITQWIKKVSVAHEKLGNKSICPFAKNAKFQIIQVSALDVDPVLIKKEVFLKSYPLFFILYRNKPGISIPKVTPIIFTIK